ncbi:MAG: GNAT family N-acetyltransferase [Cyanobacteria bacterium RI_101]|nr:GNAT family N-acetyltransferase [Cyanobacteria bacterium RI_101]
MAPPQFCLIPFGSPAYGQALLLRQAILRAPLGLVLQPEELEREADCFHYGLWDEGQTLLGYGMAAPQTEEGVKIRQFLIHPDYQRRGLGAFLLQTMEERLQTQGYRQCSLHARLQSAGFYLKQGYIVTSAVFWEVTLPHVEMKKRLTAPPVADHKKTPPV